MARINLEGMFETLAPELQRALGTAVRELHPGLAVEEAKLYRAFRRAATRNMDDWADIPSHYMDV